MSTQTSFLHLIKPAYGDPLDVASLNTNVDLIDAAVAALSGAVGGITVSVIAADDADNPTAEFETPAPVLCMTVTGTSGNTSLGFKIAASSSGYLFGRTLDSGAWSDWSQIVNVTNDTEEQGLILMCRPDPPEEDETQNPETEE